MIVFAFSTYVRYRFDDKTRAQTCFFLVGFVILTLSLFLLSLFFFFFFNWRVNSRLFIKPKELEWSVYLVASCLDKLNLSFNLHKLSKIWPTHECALMDSQTDKQLPKAINRNCYLFSGKTSSMESDLRSLITKFYGWRFAAYENNSSCF